MSKLSFSRRQFLKGTAGLGFSFPLVSALSPLQAQMASSSPPRLIYLFWGHGGVNSASEAGDFFPQASRMDWLSRSLVGDQSYREATLPTNLGGNDQISEVFGPEFNPYLNKMTFIQGMDILQYLGHCRFPFGGIADGVNGNKTTQARTATVDQFIANSPNFYPQSFNGLRSVHYEPLGSGHSPSANVGPDNKLESVPSTRWPGSAYRDLAKFLGTEGSTPQAPAQGPTVVNKIIDRYRTAMGSNRLSSFDKGRLDQFMQGLSDIERQLVSTNTSSLSCDSIPEPESVDGLNPGRSMADGVKYAGIFNNVLVSALQCGLTRIGILGINGLVPNFPSNNQHHEMWHRWDETDGQNYIKEAVRYYFNSVLIDLVRKLDATTDTDGNTLLDNTIVVVMAENSVPHDNYAHPIVTFGGGGGRFATGKYLDYRDRLLALTTWSDHAVYSGIPKQTFFNSILQGFGIMPNEYEKPRSGIYQHGGYGAQYVDGDWGGDSNDIRQDVSGRDYIKKKKASIYEHWNSSGIITLADQTLPGFYL